MRLVAIFQGVLVGVQDLILGKSRDVPVAIVLSFWGCLKSASLSSVLCCGSVCGWTGEAPALLSLELQGEEGSEGQCSLCCSGCDS